MKRVYFLLTILAIVSRFAFCVTTDVSINAFKVDRTEGFSSYVYPAIHDPNDIDMSIVQSSQVDISARGASGDGIVAFSWVLYGNVFGAASVSFNIGPMTYVDEDDIVHYIPFSMTFVCGETMISHFSVPYNSNSPIESNSFTIRENNKTYKFKYSDIVTSISTNGGASSVPASLAAARTTLSWDVNPGAGTHTANQSFTVNYNMSSRSIVSVGDSVLSNQSQYPTVCNQWNRSGTAYIKMNIDANAEFSVNNTRYTASSGIYRSMITVTCTGQ